MLYRKLFRDLLSWRAQILAIALVAAGGIAVYVAMQSVYDSLQATQQSYYAKYRFADVFASLVRAPDGVARRLRGLDGVQAVETRVVQDVNVDLPGREDAVTARLISIPQDRRPSLDDLYLRSGRYIAADKGDEAIANEAFAEANGLKIGDRISAVINRRHHTFRIVGIALSPEYVYQIRDATDLWGDSRHFGVMWVGHKALAAAFDMTGAFNSVAIRLAPNANVDRVIGAVDRVLDRYGTLGAIPASQQPSNRFLSDELSQLRVQAIVIPATFLCVAAFLLNMSLLRFVALQRTQIAILKALGIDNVTITLHYAAVVAVIMGIGAVLGIGIGAWFGWRLTIIYTHFFHFPLLAYRINLSVPAVALAVTGGASILGALSAVTNAVRLHPAEAMRPPSPPVFRPTLIERLGLARSFPIGVRMILRNMERKPAASVVTMFSIGFAAAMLVLGRFGYDAIGYMMDVQFKTSQREDVDIVFSRALGNRARYELNALPGVRVVEPFRAVYVRLSAGSAYRRVAILGLPPDGSLVRIVDKDLHRYAPPSSGMLLSKKLADILHVRAGQLVDVQVLEGRRLRRSVRVSALIDDIIGLNAYMDEGALHRLLGEDRTISGAYVTIDPKYTAAFDRRLKDLPAVASVAYRQAMLQQFERTVGESMGLSISFLVGFASVIAWGVVYNAGRVAISERSNELSTLRVLGFTRREIAFALLGEVAIVVVAAIPVGCYLGYLMCLGFGVLYDTEAYRIPVVVDRTTYAFAAIVVVTAAALSSALLKRELDRLDLLAVLKEAQ